MTSPPPLADVRSLFDVPDDVAYLNSAYQGPVPKMSLEAGFTALVRKGRPWTIAADDFFAPVELLRGAVADLLGADAEGVAVTPSVSYGVATAAANLPVPADSAVVVLEGEFPSSGLAWQARAGREGASVQVVPTPSDSDWTAAVLAVLGRLGEQVSVVAVPCCHWTDGSLVDVAAVGRACRAVGAAMVVDTAQWLGAAPFDARAIGADVVVGATYKWLLGPYSVGFAWFAERWRQGTPIEHNWIARAGSDDFARLVDPSADFRPGARRYDMGEVSNFALLPVAQLSARLVHGWGADRVARHARGLTDRIADGAAALGFAVPDPHLRSDHLMGLGLPPDGPGPQALAGLLADRQVHVSVRGSSVRVSAHAFNTVDDADRLVAALAAAMEGGA